MKIEIVNRRNAVEVRQLNEDGTMTVYLCENPQAALFKIASLVYSIEEPKEEARRSILVGTFGKKKKQPKRPNLEDLAKDVAKQFEKKGVFKLQDLTSPDDSQPLVPSVVPTVPFIDGGSIHLAPVGIIPTGIGGIGSGDLPTIDVNAAGTGQGPVDESAINITEILASIESPNKIGGFFGLIDDEPMVYGSNEFAPGTKVFKTTITASP